MQSLPDTPTTRDAICPAHGPYTATNLHAGRIWTRCPDCAQAMEAERVAQVAAAKAREAEAHLEHCLAVSGLQGRFLRAAFTTYQATAPAQRQALAMCRAFAEDFDPSTTAGGLWLIGPPGTGKTHLGSAIVNHLIRERRVPARIHAVHELMALARARFGGRAKAWEDGGTTADEFIANVARVPVLVLDEIGVSRGSEWEAEQLFAVVDARYKAERPTIVISNLPAAQLKTELGHRVYDRLREGATQVPMDWTSYRGARQ